MRKIDLTAAACIIHDNKVLLMHHKKLNMWLFPGGHIDANETPDVAVVREVKEETGLDFRFLHMSGFDDCSEELQKNALPFHTNLHSVGDHDHYGMYFLGTVDDPAFASNAESYELRWFTREEVETLDCINIIKSMAKHGLDICSQLLK